MTATLTGAPSSAAAVGAAAATSRRVNRAPLGSIGTAAVVATAYLPAAFASKAAYIGPEGVAVFWPAAGIAAGLAIGLGRPAWGAVAAGTFIAGALTSLLFDRSPALAASLALAHAAQPLLVAWLLASVAGAGRSFSAIRSAIGLFAAAATASALAAAWATIAMTLLGSGAASLAILWRTWALSDFVGLVVFTPAAVAVVDLIRRPRRGHDWSADFALLTMFAVLCGYMLSARVDDGTWQSLAPGALLMPALIWLAARSEPIVPALAVVLLAVIMAAFALRGIGRYGDVRLAIETRVIGAQIGLCAAALAVYSISALFAEKRQVAAGLKASERRLAAIADTVPGVVFSLQRAPDGRIWLPHASAAATRLLGATPAQLAESAAPLLQRIKASHRNALVAALANPVRAGEPLRVEVALDAGTPQERWLEISAVAVHEADSPPTWHGFIQDMTARHRAAEEASHRTRNLLTVVQAVTEHTARDTPTAELPGRLRERLSALATSHELLASGGWEGADIGDLVQDQLGHLASLFGSRLVIDGPPLVLRPPAAQSLGMALHELATNACKHGALSAEGGAVRLQWRVRETDGGRRFEMTWEETGPPCDPTPPQPGFGHKVIHDMPIYQLGAEIEIVSGHEGLAWRLSAPLERVAVHVERDAS